MKTVYVFFILLAMILTGCQNKYYTDKDYQSVRKIDTHVHIDSDMGYFEKQAIKDNFQLLTINVDTSDSLSVQRQHDYSIISIKKYPGTVFYAATFYFDTTGWGTEDWSKRVISHLKNNISGGAKSVKFWKNIGMVERDRNGKFIMIDDPAIKPVFDFLVSLNLPVVGHLGEPKNCWLPLNEMTVSSDSNYFANNPKYHMFLHPEYPSYDAQIEARDHMLELHPDLKFIGCHLGSLEWNVDELAKRLDKFPNMAVDMAERICHLQYQSAKDREKIRNFCIKYQDRLLYGTDLEANETDQENVIAKHNHDIWFNDWKYFATNDEMISDRFRGKFTGLQLPKEVVNKIFRENAIRWYKL
jgi:predicted TIM-barrel fold metal-dependent hydrolase